MRTDRIEDLANFIESGVIPFRYEDMQFCMLGQCLTIMGRPYLTIMGRPYSTQRELNDLFLDVCAFLGITIKEAEQLFTCPSTVDGRPLMHICVSKAMAINALRRFAKTQRAFFDDPADCPCPLCVNARALRLRLSPGASLSEVGPPLKVEEPEAAATGQSLQEELEAV